MAEELCTSGQLVMVDSTTTPVQLTGFHQAFTLSRSVQRTSMADRLTLMKSAPQRWPSLTHTTPTHTRLLVILGQRIDKW